MALSELLHLYNNSAQDDFFRQLSFRVLANIHVVPECSSHRLAELCYVSQSSVRALAKRLGFSSYSDFKAAMKWDLNRYPSLYKYYTLPGQDFVQAALGGIHKALDCVAQSVSDANLESTARAILAKPKTCFITMQGSPQQSLLQQTLILQGRQAAMYTVIQGEEAGVQAADKDTAMVFIKMNLIERTNTYELSRQAKEQGAATILVTNAEPMQEQRFFDHILCFTGANALTDMYGIDAILQMLCVKIREMT